MSSPAAAGLKEFFEEIWGTEPVSDEPSYVYLPVKEGMGEASKVRKFFLQWPEKADAVVRHVLKYAADTSVEVFYSPALYSKMSARHDAVRGSWCAWADFDGNFPEKWPVKVAPKPSIEVQSSSATKRHTYWKLDSFATPKEVERINRSLAYALSADTSGWDANQFLRPPYSVNRKYGQPITAKVVANRTEISPYDIEAFAGLPTPAEAIRDEIDLDTVPSIEDVRALATWDADVLELFNTTEKEAKGKDWDRSGGLARLAYKGAELGWTDEQIYAALLDADTRWGKYAGRSTQQKILIELINRARAKIGYEPGNEKALLQSLLGKVERTEQDEEIPDFLSIGQINRIPGREDWIVEGLLTKNGLGLITGRPGTGKTQLALQLAGDLACGRGSFLDYPLSGKPLKVLFLSLEMSVYQLQHFTAHLAVAYPDKEIEDNLVIYGKGEPVLMNQEAGQRLVDQWLDEYKPDVVIVDSLSQATSDMSNDDEMSKFFGFLKVLRRYHSFGLVFVHHHRKKANDAASRKAANSQSDIYGSYQIAATIDFALDLEDRNDENGDLDLQLLKARFMPTGDTVKISRDDHLHFTVTEDLGEMLRQQMLDPSEKGDRNGPLGISV